MKKKVSLNMFFSMLLQLVTIGNGLIIPRLILGTFGSEVNGLISSINQLLNYISLLEGGIASVMMATLYKPLVDGDEKRVSSLVKTMSGFFRTLSLILVIYTFILGAVYPFVVKTSFSWMYIFSLTVILSLNTLIQFTFAISYKLLLDADNKIYLTAVIQIICTVLNTLLVYIGLKVYPDIHIVKIITAAVFLLQPVGYHLYVNRNYRIDKHSEKDEKAIAQRWDGFGINLAAFVHNNTDVVILTAFTDLFTVSVYSVYHLVFNGLKNVIGAIFTGMVPTLGKMLAKGDEKELLNYYEIYEFLSFSLSAVFFSIGTILIIPFVKLYTHSITDADYYQPVFAVIMMAAEFFYCIRSPYLNLAYQSGHFKDISKYAYMETTINVIVSVILVRFWGILGVAVGTLGANAYRTIAQVIFSRKIINRNSRAFIKYTAIYLLMGTLTYAITRNTKFSNVSIRNFIAYGIYASAITGIMYLIITFIFFRKYLKKVYHVIHY